MIENMIMPNMHSKVICRVDIGTKEQRLFIQKLPISFIWYLNPVYCCVLRDLQIKTLTENPVKKQQFIAQDNWIQRTDKGSIAKSAKMPYDENA